MNQVAAVAPQPAAATRRDRNIPRAHHWGQSPVPAALLLAVIPLVLFGGPAAVSRPTPSPPIVPVQVATEGVRVIRMDATTFRGRWLPINDMPPATVMQQKGGGALSQEITGKPVVAVARPLPPAVRMMRRVALRHDLCSRHNMHKQYYTGRGGYQHWRCRR